MRSIRLALMGYFLLLVGVALGAVFFLVYRTSSETLNARKAQTRALLEAQHQSDCDDARAALDQRLVRSAQTLANLARATPTHFETLYPLGVLGIAVAPNGYLAGPLWLAEGFHAPLAYQLYRIHPQIVHIESADDVMHDQDSDYFQTYSAHGRPLERSTSLGETWLTLDQDVRKKAELLRENFDTLELRPGHMVRRVTLKATVPRFGAPFLQPLWRFPLNPGKAKFSRGGRIPKSFDATAIFVQYASDTSGLDATLRDLKSRLDSDLEQQEHATDEALAGLRTRLLGIGGLAFIALLAGTYWLVRLGLLPLRRLSDAVSRVSEKDFRLQVEAAGLPGELRPIASCLSETLEQLRRAFAREKQAAADISHELRTPLAALLTTLDVALRRPRSVLEYQEILEDCRTTGAQMTQQVERLLALARLDAGADHLQSQKVNVIDLATQCSDLVRPLAEARGVTVRCHVDGPAVLSTDPDKLREVLNNLLYNAVEYNRPNGSIDLTVLRDNGTLALEVRDTGIGIPVEACEHIFERFYRADPSRHADSLHAGIGLAIVKGYVELMGGTIRVESSSAGSTFLVKFPDAE